MNRKAIIILCVFTAVMALIYGQLHIYNNHDSGFLYQLDKNEVIETIKLNNANGSLNFYKNEKYRWMVEEGNAYSVNETKMELLLSSLKNLKVLRRLDTSDVQYGFEDYRAMVSFTTNQGKHHQFILGNPTMAHMDSYVKNMDNGEVIVTDAEGAAQLGAGLSAYRQKELFTVEIEKAVSLTYQRGREKIVSVKADELGEWQMVYPFEAPARKIEILEFLSNMKDWNIYGYMEEPENAQKGMGLDGTGEFLTIKDSDGEEQTLEFGISADSLTVVRNGGKADILLLYSDEIDLDILSPEALLLVAPFKHNIDKLESIEVVIGDARLPLSINLQTGEATYENRSLDATMFNRFYVTLMGLSASGGETEEIIPEEPVLLSIQMNLKDRSVIKVDYSIRDNDTCYMTMNGSTRYYTDRDKLAKLLARLYACIEEEKNK